MTAHNRALGAFYGLALGDALGMPTQSLSREQMQGALRCDHRPGRCRRRPTHRAEHARRFHHR